MIQEYLSTHFEVLDESKNTYLASIDKLESKFFALKCHFPYLWFLDISYRKHSPLDYQLKYSFLEAELKESFFIYVNVGISDRVKSLAHLWRSARIYEQELSTVWKINFSRAYTDLMEAKVTDYDYELNHPPMKLKLDTNIVKKLIVENGFFHLGIEQKLVGRSFHECFDFIQSYFSQNNIFFCELLCQVAEKGMKLKVPDRAQALRMVLLELNRSLSHLFDLQMLAKELCLRGAVDELGMLYRKIQALFVSYAGNEFGKSLITLGGVTKDVTQDWVSRTINELGFIHSFIKDVKQGSFFNQINQELFQHHIINKDVVAKYSLSGPVARACGVNIDLRKISPSYFYSDVDFKIPIGVHGSGRDLVEIKFAEISESINIMTQVLDNLPTGHFIHQDFLELFKTKTFNEEIKEPTFRDHLKRFQSLKDFSEETFIEGRNGIMGIHLDYKNNMIENIHFTISDRGIKKIFEETSKGRTLDDLALLWREFSVDLKEVER